MTEALHLFGLCKFKMGFNAKLVEFVGVLEYGFSPLYLFRLFRLLGYSRKLKSKISNQIKYIKEKNTGPRPTWDDYR
jgi:lipid II:glycine glycyltransferase (peptidoglycan interpeptide bridge formation enzyme)